MTYRKATYEEYARASEFAHIRYKIGVYVQILAVVLFIFTLLYVVMNIEEMKANPADYAEKKLGVECIYPLQTIYAYGDYNGSIGNITSIGEGG